MSLLVFSAMALSASAAVGIAFSGEVDAGGTVVVTAGALDVTGGAETTVLVWAAAGGLVLTAAGSGLTSGAGVLLAASVPLPDVFTALYTRKLPRSRAPATM